MPYKYKSKTFKSKRAKAKYKSWEPIIKKAQRDGAPKTTLKMMRTFRDSWVGK